MVDVSKNSSMLQIYLASVLNLIRQDYKFERCKDKYGILTYQSMKFCICIHQHPRYGLGGKQNIMETIATNRYKTQSVLVEQVDIITVIKSLQGLLKNTLSPNSIMICITKDMINKNASFTMTLLQVHLLRNYKYLKQCN